MTHGFLIDMDGVIYRGSQLIPGAAEFIAELQRLDYPFLFLVVDSIVNLIDTLADRDESRPPEAAAADGEPRPAPFFTIGPTKTTTELEPMLAAGR